MTSTPTANQHDAEALMHWNMHREYEMNVRRWQEFEERRGRRLADGRQVEAGPDGEGVVDPDEEPEWLINVREQIAEVEDGMDCRAGAHGRELQYHDSTFPHDWASIGEATAASSIVEWRVARAININAESSTARGLSLEDEINDENRGDGGDGGGEGGLIDDDDMRLSELSASPIWCVCDLLPVHLHPHRVHWRLPANPSPCKP